MGRTRCVVMSQPYGTQLSGAGGALARSIESRSGIISPLGISVSGLGLSKEASLDAIAAVAPQIMRNYGGGNRWIERIAEQIDDPDKVAVAAALSGAEIAAVAVLRPKGLHRLKIATFFVKPEWRGRGLAAGMARAVTEGSFDAGYDEVVLTCPADVEHIFGRILGPIGFRRTDSVWGRYGERAESVFCASSCIPPT